MLTLIGLSGSLRRGSFNSAVLRTAATMVPADCELRIESIAEFPLYNGDVEAEGLPAPVMRLKELIVAADGLLLVSPEYNYSVPGVAKNAIDWLSRPSGEGARVFGRKPLAIAGASPGGFGTVRGQSAWLPVFRALGADLYPRELLISRAASVIDAQGQIIDATTRENLAAFVAGFVDHVRARKR